MVKSAGDGDVLLIVSLPVDEVKTQEYEAGRAVPLLSCVSTSEANVVPSCPTPAVSPTLRLVDTFAAFISSMSYEAAMLGYRRKYVC